MARRPTVPSYRLHKQSGQAVVTLSDAVTRRRRDVLLGPHGTPVSRAEYARVVAEWEASGRRLASPPGSAPADLTVNELVLAFIDYAEAHYPPEGREARQFKLSLRPLRKLYGHAPATSFGPRAIKAVRQAMLDARRFRVRFGDGREWWAVEEQVRPAGAGWEARRKKRWEPVEVLVEETALCRNVVNRRITRIKTVFKWAVEQELLPGDVYHALQAVRALPPNAQGVRLTAPVGPAFWESVQAVLPFCPPPVAAMLRLQWLTGMRSGEVRRMRTCDLDRADPACWLYRPGSDAGPHGAHKNAWRGQDRVVPLGPQCVEVLTPFLRPDDPAAFLFCPARAEAARNAMRRGDKPPRKPKRRRKGSPRRPPGTCYTAHTYPQAVRRACAKAGVDFHPYMLRHGRKMVVERAAGSDAARAVLGQKSIDSTAHYGALDVATAREIMTKIG
jgi:integrase